MTSRWVVRLSVAALAGVLVLVPVTGAAQQASGIAGVVRDSSGGVLPGVTVEAASPALIEKVRAVVTDGEGRYSLVDLRIGTYTVTFSLAGFNTLKREGVVLTAGFTATVNTDMQVGALEETITVTGAAPLVDTQNVRQQKVISSDLLATLPTSGKSPANLAQLIPGMEAVADVGGSGGIYVANRALNFHGKSGSKLTYDGMNTRGGWGAGDTVGYVTNPNSAQEVAVETGAISAQSSQVLLVNLIPKEGGNAFAGEASGAFSFEGLQMDNLNAGLRARGVTTAAKVLKFYESNVTLGGPIKRDRLWFFVAGRALGTKSQVPGVFFNKTKGTPFYTPDLDQPAYRREWLQSGGVRLTWQASEKNKVSAYADLQGFFNRGRGEFAAPEAYSNQYNLWPQYALQGNWSAPMTSKLLLEAGVSYVRNRWPYASPGEAEFAATSPEAISILELSTGFRYNAKQWYGNRAEENAAAQRFSVSYVTGSHTFKAGAQLDEGVSDNDVTTRVNQAVTYDFLRGVPNRINQFAPATQTNRILDLGLYAQDRWSLKRLTLNFGLRFERLRGWAPDQQVPATRFIPARDYAAVHHIPLWTDLNPRLGASYDLFGTGRTALRVSLGRYAESMGTGLTRGNNPISTSVVQVARTWNDTNQNYNPDCDLHNFSANRECGPISDQNFGQNNPLATRFADEVLHGGLNGARGFAWDVSTEVQHELRPGVSVTAGYYRNWSGNFRSGDNLKVTPGDFSPYCITAPVDPRLPGGGGYQVCGLYDVAPAKFGQVDNLVAKSSDYYGKDARVTCSGTTSVGGISISSVACGTSDFFNVGVSTRFGSGAQLGGGVDTGRTVLDNCFVIDSPQQRLNCHVVRPYSSQTQIKVYGSYPLPAGFAVSGTLQNLSGAPVEANYQAPNAVIAPSLGRNLAACGTRPVCTATALVPLYAPYTQFEPRRTQLDLRLSKVWQLSSRARLQANLDLYNVLNASDVLGVNANYGASWLQPIANPVDSFMPGRLFHLGGRLSF